MSELVASPRALLHLLFNGARAIDVVETAWRLGLLQALEAGPVTLGALSERFGLMPKRLYKFLDCLESLGLVKREQPTHALEDARYTGVRGLNEAAERVVGPASLERDRDANFPWRQNHGHLVEVLRGERHVPPEVFDWPPNTPEKVARFEASMAAGLGPILEAFGSHGAALWLPGQRLLDVGGGDGTMAAALLAAHPELTVDVYNLPATEGLVVRTQEKHGLGERLGFVGGDFLREPLPRGYDAMAFVRVLHDWPWETARMLMKKAYEALPAGGRILICEEFRNSERMAAQFFYSYFLVGIDSCVSRLCDVEAYRGALREVGFKPPEVLPGPFELIVAEKP
ncbi:methyltransferase [Hyalangium rubrum]|uniref:Methyltransferase n=1 Tax=Hyalangium rubrum TaxID=3103134 RepID=A0ABU5GXC7_9BACT|nr:methyltransferase [Hyalangium sp. s54d21]MDY7225842.1 methyltransferase [Hyalangium sp. s54d21]